MNFVIKFLLVVSALCILFGSCLSQPPHYNVVTGKLEKMKAIIMDNMFNGSYDKRIRPHVQGGPVLIILSLDILDFYNIDENNHEFTAQLYFRQSWQDERLAFLAYTPQTYNSRKHINFITLDAENAKKMWIPDTFIANERRATRHDVTVQNEYTRISPIGEILRSTKLTVTASCPMELRFFPFDTNLCRLEFESYGHTMKDLYYSWKPPHGGKSAIATLNYIGGPDHRIIGYMGKAANVSLATGNYSRLAASFLFARSSGRYIRDVYIPSAVITIIAFITLSIGTPSFRVLLSLICMLGMLSLMSMTCSLIPQVHYRTCLHLYVETGFYSVCATVIVNFFAYHLLKRQPKSNHIQMREITTDGHADPDHDMILVEDRESFPPLGKPQVSNTKNCYIICDKLKLFLPIMYLGFNIWYWPSVFIHSKIQPHEDLILAEEYTV